MALPDELRRAQAEALRSRWVSLSRRGGLSVEAVGRTLTIRQAPAPRIGTVVREVRAGVQTEWAVPGWNESWCPHGASAETFSWLGDRPIARVSLDEKLDRVRTLSDRLGKHDARIAQVAVRYREFTEETRIVTDAFDRTSHLTRVMFSVEAVASRGGRTEVDYAQKGAVGGFELASLSDEDVEAVLEGAIRLLDAESVDPGVYQVVTGPDVSGVLAHEAFGHGVEMDLFLSDRARAKYALGRRVGSELATIVDDPTLPGGFGGYPFDDDGTLAGPRVILDRGILTGGLADADAAAALGGPGGSGRRQDYSRKVYPRMSNTYFKPGTSTPDGLIAGVERGIYLKKVESGMEDPKSWGLQITCHVGEEIRDGKLTGRLYRTLGMTGYVPDVLMSIDGAADDFEGSPGYCGKGWKEWLTNGTGGPHLRMRARIG